jgi:hypothetical protein
MTEEAMSPLRRRMIEDMTIRKLAPKTQHDYVIISDPIRRPFISRFTVPQLAGSARSQSHTSPAALKSP